MKRILVTRADFEKPQPRTTWRIVRTGTGYLAKGINGPNVGRTKQIAERADIEAHPDAPTREAEPVPQLEPEQLADPAVRFAGATDLDADFLRLGVGRIACKHCHKELSSNALGRETHRKTCKRRPGAEV